LSGCARKTKECCVEHVAKPLCGLFKNKTGGSLENIAPGKVSLSQGGKLEKNPKTLVAREPQFVFERQKG